jgi:hypothetical protein
MTLEKILQKKGDINQIPKDDMEVYTIYQMFQKNGNVFTVVSRSEGDELSNRMRDLARLHLLEYTSTPSLSHIKILKNEHVKPSHTFKNNQDQL